MLVNVACLVRKGERARGGMDGWISSDCVGGCRSGMKCVESVGNVWELENILYVYVCVNMSS